LTFSDFFSKLNQILKLNLQDMPLYMDIHLLKDVSVEDVRKAHLQDLAVQEKYGVTYHQYWINEAEGTVYCLMEGPDKESCEATHREANGITACQIVEIEGGIYDLFMGKNHKLDHGLVRHEDGRIDSGYRFILTLDITAKTKNSGSINLDQLKLPLKPKHTALQVIDDFEGKEVKTGSFHNIVAVFETPEKALCCAHEIQKEFLKYQNEDTNDQIFFNMGISVGQPLTKKEGFFVKAIQMSQRFCVIAGDKEIMTSRLFEELCDTDEAVKKHICLRSVKSSEQSFLENLLDITESRFSDYNFGVDILCREIGISRPQLYRKVSALTGRSPVSFIRDIRLQKALSLMKENKYNICEIAMEVGYHNPSYFSKCFHEKYGINPSQLAV
jgi:AraC-like DNA-binding protein